MATLRRPQQQQPADPHKPPSVEDEVLKEARRYQTVETVTSWPLVYNVSTDIADYYTSLKVSVRALMTFQVV